MKRIFIVITIMLFCYQSYGQKPRARDTVASATAALFADGRLNSGDIIVAVSGSPEAITGRTSSIRMLQIGDEGIISDL